MKETNTNKQKTFVDELKEYLENMTPDQIEEMREHFKDRKPKGWLDIEQHLPGWRSDDLMKGYTEVLVIDINGETFTTNVSDHNMWYYDMKEINVVAWLND